MTILYAIAIVACCVFAPRDPVVASLVVAVLGNLLAAEMDRSGRRYATWLLKMGTRMLPKSERVRWREEWNEDLRCAQEAGMRPVLVAWSILIRAVPRLAWRQLRRRWLSPSPFVELQWGLGGDLDYRHHKLTRRDATFLVYWRGPDWDLFDWDEMCVVLNILVDAERGPRPLRHWLVRVRWNRRTAETLVSAMDKVGVSSTRELASFAARQANVVGSSGRPKGRTGRYRPDHSMRCPVSQRRRNE